MSGTTREVGLTACPGCAGTGENVAFINRGPDIRTHSFGPVRCSVCAGKGTITLLQAERMKIGKIMRDERVALGKSLRDAAAELGCTPAELSTWENTGKPVSEQRAEKLP